MRRVTLGKRNLFTASATYYVGLRIRKRNKCGTS